ncbi:MAG: DEAD/DEAH box helicase family protein [Deltaproteobacteria bacterium]|nr:DEAD/DEAH box helicase family protein [Kofleriaceae bacterium]
MSALGALLDLYRAAAQSEREKGTYFEELTIHFLKNEPFYRERYKSVLTYAEWAEQQGLSKLDTGIDLVAETRTGEMHAIQCKLFAAGHRVEKADIDSFFTASGKKPFTHRIIIATTDLWSSPAEAALIGQHTPVTKIDLATLENSVIDWAQFAPKKAAVFKKKKELRPHQQDAVRKVLDGFQKHDRGKLLMACGTGKTFTSLKVAEEQAGSGKRVLFLVPSLALLSQSLSEWTHESKFRLQSFAVCSDSDVGNRRTKDSDVVQTLVHELQYPATTDARRLATEMKKLHDAAHMTVVFATYHSIEVVHEAQKKHDLPAFDLIVCDEAHRTTGAKFENEDESHFTKIHDADYIRGKRRLYMTATPKIFGEVAKATAERDNVELSSMDDEERYGPYLHTLTFSEAVKRGLLVDYKVVVLAVEEAHVSARIQDLLKDDNNQLRVDDAAKIIGCWKALAKHGLAEELTDDAAPMKRAVAFCQVIERPKGVKVHKVASKQIAEMFTAVVEAYHESEPAADGVAPLRCEASHIDGGMNASQKEARISWLKAESPENTCRILSNVRCLSEGVDVPALDAVLFLTPRNSQIDVVQSVGRVMRNAPGKKRGYIVLPVVIPYGVEPHVALNDNETYRVVWQVLQALRSHDDRFDAMINKLDLIGKDPNKMEVVAVTDKVVRKGPHATGEAAKKKAARRAAKGGQALGTAAAAAPVMEQQTLQFEIGEIEKAIYAKLVQKVGNRRHWEDWAKDIAKIATTHIGRITDILENKKNTREREVFARFVKELRDDLNDSISEDEVIEMLAQHLVTKPVFDALFSGHNFATENSMSKAMQSVLELLEAHRLDKESDTLQAFYESVKLRAEGIESAEGKQKIVVELYEKFFKGAFPKMSERLGIVYTPVEIVDFILKSVDELLRSEFGQHLGSENVHILDPFTGTGTFITRLLQSGLIAREDLPRKYAKEIHANEIVLLAYYIAAINIEAAYHGLMGGEYRPFEGICLTDTFQLYEKDDLIQQVLVDNSARRKRQKKLDIRVIVGNPPYSVGQKDDNDDAANISYPRLDERLKETYVARSTGNPRSLYDSYVRAIRWASDRVGGSGVIGFVTNAGFIDGKAADGLRQCLADEFSDLYLFHMRGNARTSGERRRKEAGNVFGVGSRAPVAISLLVKNAKASERGRIFYRDVGDYLSQEQKLEAVAAYGSAAGVAEANGWTRIQPDEHGDWLRQRDAGFDRYIALGDKKSGGLTLFSGYSNGVKTNRDAWAYNPSRDSLTEHMSRMIGNYNAAVDGKLKGDVNDGTKIGWSWVLRGRLEKRQHGTFAPSRAVVALYRPFDKTWLYYDGFFNENRYQMPRLFPVGTEQNRVIGVSASESRSGFSVLMADVVPSLHAADMVGSQFFPLCVYDSDDGDDDGELFAKAKKKSAGPIRRDGITDAGLQYFRDAYPREKITKEDVFYYVYGILHSQDYRERYADNLGKELPRMPRVKTAKDFWAFSRAGKQLGDLHVGYDAVAEYKTTLEGPAQPRGSQLRVENMKFGKGKDKTVIHYNDLITVRDIPLEAYDYVVNGKPAIEWVMERQAVTTDKASGIVKDANAWAIETERNARYPLSLLLRVITVSLETMKIVRALPALDILDDAPAPKAGVVLPFRKVTPEPAERYRTSVPLMPLEAAAGAWSEVQDSVPEPDSPHAEWVTWDGAPTFAKGMFVAHVKGRSMEPVIPDGAYCLFRIVPLPSSPERAVLVRYSGDPDPETGGQYTVKRYKEARNAKGDRHIVLLPVNPEFSPLVLDPRDGADVRVIAELVHVIGA